MKVTVTQYNNDVITSNKTIKVDNGPKAVKVSVGLQGAQGPAGSGLQLTRLSAAPLSAHRIVSPDDTGKVNYASPTAQFVHRPLWLTLTSASAINQSVDLLPLGDLTEPSWSWTVGLPLFLAASGVLTQTVPVSPTAYLIELGVATSATSIYLFPRIPIALS